MDKDELISLTLDRLIDRFKSGPECFEFIQTPFSPSNPDIVITWKPRVEMEPNMVSVIDDPNREGGCAIKYMEPTGEITCAVYSKAPINFNHSTPDCLISTRPSFVKWTSNYKKIVKLKNLILKRDQENENKKYLKKLQDVFPDAVDKYLTKQ